MTSIPIKMFAALDTERSEMHTYHINCGFRVSAPKTCTACGYEVSSDQLAKGIDYTFGNTILFSPGELEALGPPANHTLSISQFCPAYEVNPALFEKVHYISGEGEGFASLHAAMMEKDSLAIGRVVLQSKERLVALRSVWGGMLCHTLHWPEMVREPEWKTLAPATNLDQARIIVDSLTEAFIPSEFKDEYKATLDAHINLRKAAIDLANG